MKRGRVVCVGTVLAEDFHLYLYYVINNCTFMLNATSKYLFQLGWKEKIKK